MKQAERDEIALLTMRAQEALAEQGRRREQREREEERRRRVEEGPPAPRDPHRSYDALGRLIPQPIQLTGFLKAIPGLAAQFKPIPASHFEQGVVTCPCGAKTRLERQLQKCDGACGRYFANGGHRAFSAGPYDDSPTDGS